MRGRGAAAEPDRAAELGLRDDQLPVTAKVSRVKPRIIVSTPQWHPLTLAPEQRGLHGTKTAAAAAEKAHQAVKRNKGHPRSWHHAAAATKAAPEAFYQGMSNVAA